MNRSRPLAGARLVLCAAASVAFASVAPAAPRPLTTDQAIAAYRDAIRTAETARRPRAIERAFTALATLRETLTRAGDDHRTPLEAMPDSAFDQLRNDLHGVHLERVEVVLVEPDCGYFTGLAEQRGDAADRAYVAALAATYPRSVWPVYVDPQTDAGGCVRFGSMALVDTYQAWSAFRRRHPGRYVQAAGREMDAVVIELAQATCACDSVSEVERELEQFVQRFPRSPARPAIEQRLNDLRVGRIAIRPHCVAG